MSIYGTTEEDTDKWGSSQKAAASNQAFLPLTPLHQTDPPPTLLPQARSKATICEDCQRSRQKRGQRLHCKRVSPPPALAWVHPCPAQPLLFPPWESEHAKAEEGGGGDRKRRRALFARTPPSLLIVYLQLARNCSVRPDREWRGPMGDQNPLQGAGRRWGVVFGGSNCRLQNPGSSIPHPGSRKG